jgi:phosphoribosylanthranilate isomerase
VVAVKVCGVCRPEDAAVIAAAGADYLGVILAPGSRRSRTVAEADAIFAEAPGCRRVGVFVDAPTEEMLDAARALALDVLQLHGGEGADVIARLRAGFGGVVWKAVRPRGREEVLEALTAYGDAVDGLLLDGWSAGAAGGTGARFPWDEVAEVREQIPQRLRLVVAGGLAPENVAEAVVRFSPAVVDVSSGVERAVGEKDPERIRAFVAAARGNTGEGDQDV